MVVARRAKVADKKTFFVCTIVICIVFVYNMYFMIQAPCHGLLCIPVNQRMNIKQPQYLIVNTSTCKIKDLSHSGREIRRVPRQLCPHAPFTVSEKILRTTKNVHENGTQHTNCCVRNITREEQGKNNFTLDADWLIKTSKMCLPILTEGIQLNSSFLQVECDEIIQKNKSKYVDYVVTVLPPEELSNETGEKVKFWKQINTTTLTNQSFPPPSILILGINGMSRLHSIRALRQTRKFLSKNDFVEMKGFNKIGFNTFANMMGALTGLPLNHGCYEKPKNMPLDECPFIWKNFSMKNYITGLVEDSPGLAMFNYDKIGFVHQPVDYSIRTAMVALQKYAKVDRRIGLHNNCVGGITLFDNLFNYNRKFLEQIAGKYPFFLLTWFKTLKANYLDSIINEDINFTKFLSDVLNNEYSNNTFIFVLSSHGQEFGGSQSNSYISHFEEGLPMHFIRIPPSLKNILPDWFNNLKINSNLLTNPYDLYATLQNILTVLSSAGQNYFEIRAKNSKNLRRQKFRRQRLGYSFFEKIPQNRTCRSSSIPELYCRCDTTPLLFKNSTLAQELGNAIVSTINFNLLPVLGRQRCVPLHFNRLLYGRLANEGIFSDHLNRTIHFVDYFMGIEVSPSLATFEASVRDASDDTQIVIGDVRRVSSVQNQSCVSEQQYVDYCFCHESYLQQRIQKSKNYMKWSSKT